MEGRFGERMADLHFSQAFAKDASDPEVGDARWIREAGATVLLVVEEIDDGLDGEVELLGGFFLSERPARSDVDAIQEPLPSLEPLDKEHPAKDHQVGFKPKDRALDGAGE